MNDARRDRARRALACVLLVALSAAQSALAVAWIDRNGFFERPFTSDAAWYRIDALRMKRGYEAGGVVGWLAAGLEHDRPHPPYVVMAVGLVSGIRGEESVSLSSALAVIHAFGALFVFGTYRLARRFVGRGGAVGAAALAASFPAIIPNLRPLYPQFPMAACLPWVFAALLRTEGFARRGPSVAFGAVAGAATMVKMLAPLYFGGAAAAALAFGLARKEGRGRVGVNLLLGLAAAAVVAAPWYVLHFESVRTYADNVTGEEGQRTFSSSLPADSIARWAYYPFHLLNDGVGWWTGLVLVAACVAGLRALGFAARHRGALAADVASRARDGAVLAAAPLVAYAPLTLGQATAGSFYLQPFLPLAATLLVRFVATRRGRTRPALAIWLGVLAALHQALGQRPPETAGDGRTLIGGSARAVLLTPLEDRPSVLLDFTTVPLTGDPFLDRHFGVWVLPKIDGIFGSFSILAQAVPGPVGEHWPVDACVEAMFRDAGEGRPKLTITTPYYLVHPYLGHAQIMYACALRNRSLSHTSREKVLEAGGDPFAAVADMDFVLVDERPLRDLPDVASVLAGLDRNDAVGEVVLRGAPTTFSPFSLVAIRRKGAERGPRPLADLDGPGVLRTATTFSNGWRLLGVRALPGRTGRPFLVAWFDGLSPGEAGATFAGSLTVDDVSAGGAQAPLWSREACDAERPLLAVVLKGFRAPPAEGRRQYSVRVTSAREDAYKNLAVVKETTLRKSGRANVVVPWDTYDAAATRPESRTTRPTSRPR